MLRQLHGHSGIPVLFGGQVENTRLSLSQFIGVRTAGLRGLRVRAEAGLGGRVLTTGRPTKVTDYRSARSITHDYDRPRAEGGDPLRRSRARRGVRCGARGALRGPVDRRSPAGEVQGVFPVLGRRP
ncbi:MULTISPECIES: hypothetical protein [Streptomyces]|uniref:hypothetical protein n=1 Tax=Streptomyces TaxID=1883 RepID=UPI00167EF70D|nr:hypothetical protein [Streptomyces coeruleorubidus]GGU12544.1 hypothetical protein GCM10010256_84840 [Streptomyces coeruleorubidus]